MFNSEAIVATLVLGGMCLLMWWLARLARKRMGIGSGTVSGDGLKVVGKRPLDQKHALYVIEIAGGRHILIGASAEGGMAKLDDISAAEFEVMTQVEEQPARMRPRLRIAGASAPRQAASNDDAATDGDTDDAVADAVPAPRFATVGESFGMLLGKARDARDARRGRDATSEDDAARDELDTSEVLVASGE